MRHLTAPIVLVLLATAACHTDSKPAGSTTSAGNTAPAGKTTSTGKAPANVQSQIDHGGTVFAANCAECHGASGQGGKGPRLVGAGAFPLNPRPDQKLRKIQFHTAMDVAKFVTTSMPPDPDARKEIPETDYWAVLAFALSANGVKLQAPVGPSNAASIVLNP